MNVQTKTTKDTAPSQVQAQDERIEALERDKAEHSAAMATLLAEQPVAEAKHAATVQELEAAGLEISQHRVDHPQSDYFEDAEGARIFYKRQSNPARDAALLEAESVLRQNYDAQLEAERLARVACNAIGLRLGAHQSALASIDDQLGQLRAKRAALLATHTGAGDAKSTLTRIRAGLSALMQRPEEPDIRKVRLAETWWYVADFSRVVPDGDPAAASLMARKGIAISIDRHELERLGIS